MDLFNQLFTLWDLDMVVIDYETGTYADPTRCAPSISRGVQ